MYETRLYKIRKVQTAPPEVFFNTHTVHAYPDQIGRLISAVGPIEDGDEYSVPAAAINEYIRMGEIVLQSEHVLFSEYIMALSTRETTATERETFYQHNPIPGAIWEEPQTG
jgi:hypothetical protein